MAFTAHPTGYASRMLHTTYANRAVLLRTAKLEYSGLYTLNKRPVILLRDPRLRYRGNGPFLNGTAKPSANG